MLRYPRTVMPMTKSFIDLQYKLITPDRYKDVMFHLRDVVCSQTSDPFNKSLCECIRKGGDEFVDYFTYITLKDKLSLMAVNGRGQVVGTVFNGIAKPGYLYDLRHYIDSIREPHLRNILQFQRDENREHNIFDLCKIKKAFEIRLLSVDKRNYNGRIVGKQLVRLSEMLAANKNHKVMKADATGNFSQKILSYRGFKCLNETYYNINEINDDVINDNSQPPKVPNVPLTKYQLLYKMLQ